MSGAHSQLGASSAHRWMACPGSVRLAALAPPQLTSVHAGEGTAAHALAERCLREGVPATRHLGEEISGFPVDEDMAAAVQVYLDQIGELEACLRMTHDLKGIAVEQRLDLGFVRPGLYGTADTILDARIYNGLAGELVVVDYKHGRGVEVQADDNPQFKYYALGALGPPPANAQDAAKELVQIRTVVVQPRCGTEKVRQAKFDSVGLRRWGKEVLGPAADLARSADAPLVPGEEQCRWCPAKATCPALREWAGKTAALDFTTAYPVAIGGAPKATSPESIKAAAVSAETTALARVLDAKPLIEIWLAAAEEEAQRRALAGEAIPGYKLVESMTKRRWKDEDQAAITLRKFGIHPYQTPKVIGIPDAEKGLKAAGAVSVLSDLVEKPPGQPTIAPISDKRLAWSSPEQDFGPAPGAEVDTSKHGPQGGDPMGGPLEPERPKRGRRKKADGLATCLVFNPAG